MLTPHTGADLTAGRVSGPLRPATPRQPLPTARTGVGARAGTGAAPARGHRTDIEGLRAVAVLLVVLGHAGVAGFAGGYVGVDVFFVISGFLITSLMLRELHDTGRIAVGRFYARRATRLLPAAALVLVATLLGSWWWLSPLRTAEYAGDATAAAFSFINVRLAVAGTDYLAADATPSPFQHFWSLAVEEQFYLVWPLLMVITCVAWRRRPGRGARLVGVLAVVTVISFAFGVRQTDTSAPWAYFGTPARAWELGVGALVAVAAIRLRRLPHPVATALGWAGLLAIGYAALAYDADTAFPGTAAVVPVAGAAAIVAAGLAAPRHGVARLLERPPLQTVGRLSYAWYLWHWPILMIAPTALGVAAGVHLDLALCAVALALAWCTHRLVENPVRRRRSLRSHPPLGVGLGLGLCAAVAAAAGAVAATPRQVPTGAGAADLAAAVGAAADPAASLTGFIERARHATTLPANLTPALEHAGRDLPPVYADGCHVVPAATETAGACTYGDPAATTTVVLFGDSHAAQWFPAMQRLAVQRHWRLVSLTKAACTATDAPIVDEALKRPYTECQVWHRRALARIAQLRPALIVLGSSFAYRLVDTRTDATTQWRAAWQRTVGALRATGAALTMITDTPYMGGRVPACLARHPERIGECTRTALSALRGPEQRAIVTGYAGRSGVNVVDPTPWMCADICPAVLGNVLVYRDSNHLTTVFVRMLAPLLAAGLPRLG